MRWHGDTVSRRNDMLAPDDETRLAQLRRKLEARKGKPGFKRNVEALREAIAELEAKAES
jgi:hypothetical protein